MRTLLKSALLAMLALGAGSACDVDKKKDGEMPEVEVKGGELPEVDVDTADVDLKTQTKTIETPDVDVKMEEKKVEVPDIDVKMPEDDE